MTGVVPSLRGLTRLVTTIDDLFTHE